MFSRHHRKVKVLFGLSDVFLTALAFEAAYQSRVLLHFERIFHLGFAIHALLLGFSALVWLAMGIWISVYDKLDAGNPRVILRDSLRQSLLGITCLVIAQ